MNATPRNFRILGTTDEINACDCCGKAGLKSTVALVEIDADGNDVSAELYFGCVCAARAMAREVRDVRREVNAADRAREVAARAERESKRKAKHDAYMVAWTAHLVGLTGGIYTYDGKPDIFRMMQSIGFDKAHAGFVAP